MCLHLPIIGVLCALTSSLTLRSVLATACPRFGILNYHCLARTACACTPFISLNCSISLGPIAQLQTPSCFSYGAAFPLSSTDLTNVPLQSGWCPYHVQVMSEQVFGEQLLSVCLEKVTKLLSDNMYFARRRAACLATVLYRKWTRPQASILTFAQDAPQLAVLTRGAAAAAAAGGSQQCSQYYSASRLAMTCKKFASTAVSGCCLAECF